MSRINKIWKPGLGLLLILLALGFILLYFYEGLF